MDNKVVIVTGSGKGIGRAIAERCAENGMNVVIVDVDENLAHNTAQEISQKFNVKTLAVKTDVSKEEEVNDMVRKSMNEFGDIFALVNNAGIILLGKPFEEVDNSEWNKVFSINFMGVVNCCKAVLPILKKNRKGKIVNMSSLSAYTGGMAVTPAYAASKAAIMSVTRSIAKQVAPLKINVNSVAPGLVETEGASICNYKPEQVPLNELATPDNVADAVYFLLSDEASHITGTTLDVNGGILMK
ncbi:MAG: SDR family NAD(P)-dependent oxidoreductase [Peptococcales bacterium]|jgi:NAD(P)-dependent dehydrogenase (short-subunit alcohol dehydrogenase family)